MMHFEDYCKESGIIGLLANDFRFASPEQRVCHPLSMFSAEVAERKGSTIANVCARQSVAADGTYILSVFVKCESGATASSSWPTVAFADLGQSEEELTATLSECLLSRVATNQVDMDKRIAGLNFEPKAAMLVSTVIAKVSSVVKGVSLYNSLGFGIPSLPLPCCCISPNLSCFVSPLAGRSVSDSIEEEVTLYAALLKNSHLLDENFHCFPVFEKTSRKEAAYKVLALPKAGYRMAIGGREDSGQESAVICQKDEEKGKNIKCVVDFSREGKGAKDALTQCKRSSTVLIDPEQFESVTELLSFCAAAKTNEVTIWVKCSDEGCNDADTPFLVHFACAVENVEALLLGPPNGAHQTILWNELLRVEEEVVNVHRRYQLRAATIAPIL